MRRDDAFPNKGPNTSPGSSEYGSDHESTGAHAPNPDPNLNFGLNQEMGLDDPAPPRPPSPPKENGHASEYEQNGMTPDYQVGHEPQPSSSSSTDPDPDFEWYHEMGLEDPPTPRPASQNGLSPENHMGHVNPSLSTDPGPYRDFGWNRWISMDDPGPPPQLGHVQQSNLRPSTDQDQDLDWNHWVSFDDPPTPRPASQNDLAPEYQVEHVQQPNPRPLTDPVHHWASFDDPPTPRPASQNDLAPEYQGGHVQQPNPKPLTDPDPDPDLDWNRWMGLDDPLAPSLRPESPKEIGLAPEQQVEHVQQPDPGTSSSAPPVPDHESTNVVQSPAPNPASSTGNPGSLVEPSSSTAPVQGSWDHFNAVWDDLWWYKPGANPRPATPPSPDLGSPKEPENEVVPGPPPTPESTDPSDPHSLGVGVQPEDLRAALYGNENLQDAMYAEKGKAKDSRSISGTARDVGNAAQRAATCRKVALIGGVSFFLVPHSSAYPQKYILIDIF